MKLFLQTLIGAASALSVSFCFGQAPTVNYGGMQSYLIKTPVFLSPSSNGVAPCDYSSAQVLLGSGIQYPTGVTLDAAGNIYATGFSDTDAKKIPVDGSAIVSLGSGFLNPFDIAVDAAGNVYVADLNNHAVKEIPVGTNTPVTIGSGYGQVAGVAVDATGNVYVADFTNGAIGKITPAGVTSTIASGFNQPSGVAVDTYGNIYIADDGDNAVYMLPAGSSVPVAIGSGFSAPNGVSVDAAGNVFVADYGSKTVKEILAGTNNTTITLNTGAVNPYKITTDHSGNLFIADFSKSSIQKNAPIGGYFIDKALPAGLVFNSSTGVISGTPTVAIPPTLYTITAYNSHGGTPVHLSLEIRQPAPPTLTYSSPQSYLINSPVNITPSSVGVAAPAYNSTPVLIGSTISSPTGVAIDAAGNVYACGYSGSTIKKFPAAGGTPIDVGSGFLEPYDVTVDAAGNIYVADLNNNAIKKIPVGSNTPVIIGSGLIEPAGVAVDAAGNVYFADYGDTKVGKIRADNGQIVILGSGFDRPSGVAVDAYGNVYVADYGNNAIKKIPAGSNTPVTIGTGFSLPNGVAVDASGNVFVADYGNKSVKEILAGTNTTIVINCGAVNPYKLIIDKAGDLLVADFASTSIEKVVPTGGYYISKALPSGLTFNNTTGVISGTPTAASANSNYTISAYNGGGAAAFTLALEIKLPPVPVVSYATPQNYLVNQAVSLTPAGNNVAASVYNSTSVPLGSGFNSPTGVAVDATGNVYVVSFYDTSIKKIPVGGGAPIAIGSGLVTPFDVAVDKAGNLYVADLASTTIKKFPAGSNTPVMVGSDFNEPAGVAVDDAGNVYVADYGHNAVKEVLADNSSIITLGSGFASPAGVALDGYGNVYVADYFNSAIKKILAGNAGVVTVGSGISFPNGVVIDRSGNIFEADYGSKTIKEIPAGATAAVTVNSDVTNPYKLTIDASGNLFVADFDSPSVKKVVPLGGYYINKWLPQGLTFDTNTGTIGGTPTVASPLTDYTVSAYNVGGQTTADVKIQVSATASTNAFLSALTLNGTLSPAFVKTTFSYTVTVGNSVTSALITPTASDAGAYVKVNGTATASATTTEGIPLAVGPNVVPIVVTAQDGTTTNTYTVTIVRQSNDATLSNLVLSSGPLSPAFASGTTTYTASVTNATSSITLTPTKNNTYAAIKINNTYISSGHATVALPLVVGANAIPVTVIAQDGTTKVYNLTVTRQPQGFNTATLSNLVISSGKLSPVFATGTIGYTDTVSNTTTSVKITPTVTITGATIKVNGTAVTSGAASPSISLVEGNNIISTVVTAQDGTTVKTYTIKLLRKSSNADLSALTISSGTLSPVFGSNTLAYTTTVSNATASVTITPTKANAYAGIKVNTGFVSSGKPTAAIPLKVGVNTITIIVYAQNGITTKTYTISVTRESNDATLSSLTLSSGTLSPAFASGTISYTASVSNATSSITLTPTKNNAFASIKVNGAYVSSGHATSVSLVVGSNSIPIIVIAQDGTTKTYTLTVTRAAATLNALYLPGDNEQTPLVSSRSEKVEASNILSPNGDGVNDIWVVKNIAFYPNNAVSVYNKAGELVFTKKGYANDWDGTYRGSVLSEGTYYYNIDLGNGNINKGFITVVKDR